MSLNIILIDRYMFGGRESLQSRRPWIEMRTRWGIALEVQFSCCFGSGFPLVLVLFAPLSFIRQAHTNADHHWYRSLLFSSRPITTIHSRINSSQNGLPRLPLFIAGFVTSRIKSVSVVFKRDQAYNSRSSLLSPRHVVSTVVKMDYRRV